MITGKRDYSQVELFLDWGNEWINGWMDGQMDGWMVDKWMSVQLYEWVNEQELLKFILKLNKRKILFKAWLFSMRLMDPQLSTHKFLVWYLLGYIKQLYMLYKDNCNGYTILGTGQL